MNPPLGRRKTGGTSHNRKTETFNFGNGWFERKTTNLNKKSRKSNNISRAIFKIFTENKKKSNKTRYSKESAGNSLTLSKVHEESFEQLNSKIEEQPSPPFFWEVKKFNEFSLAEWLLWLLAFPFRALFKITFYTLALMLVYFFIKALIYLINIVVPGFKTMV